MSRNSLSKAFEELRTMVASEHQAYAAVPIPNLPLHRLGITSEGQPIFFVRCSPQKSRAKQAGYRLERLIIQFSKKCLIKNNQQEEAEETFTTIELRPGADELIAYFLDVFYLLIKGLPKNTVVGDLNEKLHEVLSLFNHLSAPPKRTVQGLWAELLVIERAKDPARLVKAWHRESTDKYDFNDGVSKIEVKSAASSRRVHHFSAEQLLPNPSSQTLIISIFAIETAAGSSIDDLVEAINKRLQDEALLLDLKMKIGKTLGNALESARDHYFDYAQAADSIRLFDTNDIPKIAVENIPPQIQRVSYDSDLTDVSPVSVSDHASALLKAI
ncbi:PD-(D/E)XK motif protein [Mucilaginibacter myungsuensis]|uniref:PD-(D/E)XK motif protein n=1 Tax=Mucilaginibacter myungsuensis TaxID=649104 RepID=A0A929KWT3_9SPHI|nr:PD-(D/E)XK motif protein [Mucilaginibacter myungsuensis]MBE9663084.1 PD-(D/E)XK motif protein [Mucilaginibacter myungsuensis]MDN3598719.1 PD-(D/E)XK motif protein [Mucilaginibacter myungsuensis]